MDDWTALDVGSFMSTMAALRSSELPFRRKLYEFGSIQNTEREDEAAKKK